MRKMLITLEMKDSKVNFSDADSLLLLGLRRLQEAHGKYPYACKPLHNVGQSDSLGLSAYHIDQQFSMQSEEAIY